MTFEERFARQILTPEGRAQIRDSISLDESRCMVSGEWVLWGEIILAALRVIEELQEDRAALRG